MLQKRILRIVYLIVFIVLLFLIYKSFLVPTPANVTQEEIVLKPSGAPVVVMVFYEALCPDSKNFIIRQLQPAFDRASELMEIQFVPYGKAETHTSKDGSLFFECQHGPIECQANIIHACAIEAIHDARVRLNVVSCMIRDNVIPKEAFHKCAKENSIDIESIQKYYNSPHGSELLKLHGEVTHALRPPVTFIPTVTLDGQQGRQASILKDFFGELCKIVSGKGPKPEVCE